MGQKKRELDEVVELKNEAVYRNIEAERVVLWFSQSHGCTNDQSDCAVVLQSLVEI